MRLALLAAALLAACVIVQSSGMLLLIRWLARIRNILESPNVARRIGFLLRLFVLIVPASSDGSGRPLGSIQREVKAGLDLVFWVLIGTLTVVIVARYR
jgi:hypothetical protein